MSIVRALFILLLCFGFTPGLGELASDGVHLLADGHSHHAEGHEEPEPEHSCTGWQHNCVCCVSLCLAPAVASWSVPVAGSVVLGAPHDVRERGPTGVREQLERPPRA